MYHKVYHQVDHQKNIHLVTKCRFARRRLLLFYVSLIEICFCSLCLFLTKLIN
jgi:hypothetical protein